ncbi:MAG: 30S ribosomal protein S18 [bacterium]
MRPQQSPPPVDRVCHFCQHGIDTIDYKDVQLLRRFISSYSKIVPRKRTGACLTHQHRLSQAIKRAWTMALLPFVPQ